MKLVTLTAATFLLTASAVAATAAQARQGIATARPLPNVSRSSSGIFFGPAFSPGFSHSPSPTAPDRFRHGRRGWHDHWNGWADWGFWGYGDGDGYVDTVPTRDQFGYYSTGGAVTFDGTRPVYHYDRGYPYEFYSGSPPGPETRAIHCRVQDVWDQASRRNATVRVCTPD
jgi:hypothetical protein